jgi:hypothetical protein
VAVSKAYRKILSAIGLMLLIPVSVSAQQNGACPTDNLFHPELIVAWSEQEGGWHGLWWPKHPNLQDGDFRGAWIMGHQRMEADLSLLISYEPATTGRLTIVRRQSEGNCQYDGQIHYGVRQKSTASGTYWCSWHHPSTRFAPLPWHATIVDFPRPLPPC